MANSIRSFGQVTPIVVQRTIFDERSTDSDIFTLVDGLHRLKAFALLGRQEIEAVVINSSDVRSQQLAANLYRYDLTQLDRSEHIAELAALTEQQAKVLPLATPGGAQPRESGIRKTSRKLGLD